MKKCFAFFLFLSVLLISACNNSDELVGQTFDVAYTPVLQEDFDSPNRYSSIMTLEFSDSGVVTSTIYGEGTYDLNNNNLVLHFENENEYLEIIIGVTESDKDFSEYNASISSIDYHFTDTDKIRHLQNLALKLDEDMPIEFIKN